MSEEWKLKRKFVDPNRLTRKVFDKHVDRMEQKRKRDLEDHRADQKALFQRIRNLENQLVDLGAEVKLLLNRARGALGHESGTEEL